MRLIGALVLCGALSACASVGQKPESTGPRAPNAYVILFKARVTEVNAKAAAVLNTVAASANAHPDEIVLVSGPPVTREFGYDPRLARLRIDEVVHELEAAGVNRERIIRDLLQNANLKADGTGAQRVEIRLVSRPGRPGKRPKKAKSRTA